MKTYDCDLHMHGHYARGVSKHMTIGRICEQAKLKGLKVVGSADILHREWLDSVKDALVEKESGVLRHKKYRTAVILSNEIQTNDRIHHVLFYPNFDSVERHRTAMLKVCNHLDVDGRPKVQINSEALARSAEEVGAMIGAAHAFTPYFGLYGKYDSLAQCYGGMLDYVGFIELGLSADTHFADMIPELGGMLFFLIPTLTRRGRID